MLSDLNGKEQSMNKLSGARTMYSRMFLQDRHKERNLLFLLKIRDELNPTCFSCEEILSEGLEGVLIKLDDGLKTRKKRIKRALEELKEDGMITSVEGEQNKYRFTHLGLEYEPINLDVEEME